MLLIRFFDWPEIANSFQAKQALFNTGILFIICKKRFLNSDLLRHHPLKLHSVEREDERFGGEHVYNSVPRDQVPCFFEVFVVNSVLDSQKLSLVQLWSLSILVLEVAHVDKKLTELILGKIDGMMYIIVSSLLMQMPHLVLQ
jgi:hypothetical protein